METVNRYCCVYKITNVLTGMSYIGQTKDYIKRFSFHRKNYTKQNTYLYNAINKYGFNNFKFEVLLTVLDESLLDQYEIHFINIFQTIRPSGYNIKAGGISGVHSEEVKLKMSEIAKKRFSSIKSRQEHGKRIEAFYRTNESLEIKRRATERLKLYSHLAHEKTRELNKDIKFRNKRAKAIVDLDTNIFYISYHDAGNRLGFSYKHMTEHLKGIRPRIGGHRFRLATKEEIEKFYKELDKVIKPWENL